MQLDAKRMGSAASMCLRMPGKESSTSPFSILNPGYKISPFAMRYNIIPTFFYHFISSEVTGYAVRTFRKSELGPALV
jgi:hypothetical protein